MTVALVGAPPELAAEVADCVGHVRGCDLAAYPAEPPTINQLRADQPALVIAFAANRRDIAFADALLQAAEGQTPAPAVVVVAESHLAGEAGRLLELGVADFLVRPVSLSRLAFLIDFLTLRSRCQPGPHVAAGADQRGLVFASEAAQKLHATAARLAQAEATVLLHGETGTGKTCLARLIHDLSQRRRRPFVVANCGSLPETLLESELFGHRQGAFTGADRNHRGKFAQAEDGTLFLDEIDSLSLGAQSKLLRVVEEKSFEAIGCEETQRVLARLVFATNRDLAQEVDAGRFRRDLYYRLNVIAISLPPLRARSGEIPLLVEAYLREMAARKQTCVQRFSPTALALLGRYDWPGNLRELRNTVERVAVLCERTVADVEDLPGEIVAGGGAAPADAVREMHPLPALEPAQPQGSPLAVARRGAERDTIVRTLEQCAHNRSRAAESLGISRTAFYKKLRQLGLA